MPNLTFFDMKKKFFMTVILCYFGLSSQISQAEIIELRNEEKSFGEWKVYCEIDDMMNNAHCKIASKFYDNSSVISMQPTNNFANEFFIIIPAIKLGSFAKIRVDKNDLILSGNATAKQFGLLELNDHQKQILFNQMKNGENLYLRFNVAGTDREITTKLDLKDFTRAMSYYSSKVFKK
jgi:hypothetical protein